jgi:hypothetical protein
MLVKTTFAVLTAALLFTSWQAKESRNDSSGKQGCALLKENQAPQFISYETKLESTIRLRLTNNTNCRSAVETDDEYPARLKRGPEGGARIEAVVGSEDGLRISVHYLVQDRRSGHSQRRGYGWGDSVFVYEIPPGQSILFDVPASHFRRRLDIAVPFSYEWERSDPITTGVGGVAHRVYFLFDSLPALALR